jgi:hypothetical protein
MRYMSSSSPRLGLAHRNTSQRRNRSCGRCGGRSRRARPAPRSWPCGAHRPRAGAAPSPETPPEALCPIDRALAMLTRAAKGKRARGAARSRREPCDRGEDGEHATLPEASTSASCIGSMGHPRSTKDTERTIGVATTYPLRSRKTLFFLPLDSQLFLPFRRIVGK